MSQLTFHRQTWLSLTLLLAVAIALVWVARVGAAAGACTIPSFAAQPNISLDAPGAVVVDDFNNDGKPDLAIANKRTSGTISVLLGNGSGGFSAPTNFSCGRNPIYLASGDLNGDGNADLVTANESNFSGEVSIVLGNGSGGFGSQTSIFLLRGTPSVTTAVAIGDVNGDGKLDLALTSAPFGLGIVTVLLGSGTGTLTFFKSTAAGGSIPFHLAMKDLNGDGKVDLVTANVGSGNVGVLLGDGTGNFGTAATFAVGTRPVRIAVEDFNADSKLDLAVANQGSDDISILIGDGAGGFGPAMNHNAKGAFPGPIAAADFNGDGKIDLAVSNFEPGTVVVFTGDGAGNFSAAANFRGDGSSAVGDFNADGQMDLAVVIAQSRLVSVLLNSCGSSALPQIQFRDSLNSGLEFNSGGFPADATVIRTGDITGTASVDYATSNGTAIAPQDYIGVVGTLTFLPGEISKTITIALVDDNITEADESFNLTLSNVSSMASLGSPSASP